mmetsp:Transcript_16723/g.2731  ORF Transcript_16723/g.2731 Transcript_16723/m.2731 type:complete len:96 (-) Transcript_16723:6-293(-)
MGDHPGYRESMGFTLLGEEMFVFGGNVSKTSQNVKDEPSNDIYQMQLSGNKIMSKKICPKLQSPHPRLSHMITPYGENRLIIFGGENEENVLNDI